VASSEFLPEEPAWRILWRIARVCLGRLAARNFLWIEENIRGQGFGTRLLDEAEAFAREHGAFASTLETFTMQAPAFYAGRGYVEVGRLDDYPPGQAKLFLSKRLET
jgi:GNAT superfamily N-acetyltransferase